MSTASDPPPPAHQATAPGTNAPAADATTSDATEVSAELKTTLSTADSSAKQSLQTLQQVHQARLSQVNRAAASLQAKYGATDPRVASVQATVAASNATIGRLTNLNQQLSTPAPQVAATGWALQGRVFNSASKPIAKLTVFLVDEQKAYQSQYGFAYTDSTGYFLLNYAGAAGQPQTATPLFLEVATRDRKALFLSTTPFQPVLGSATYQNIKLPAGAQPLGEPPQAIQNVAFPSQK